jgi:hypothetical protein
MTIAFCHIFYANLPEYCKECGAEFFPSPIDMILMLKMKYFIPSVANYKYLSVKKKFGVTRKE